MEAGSEVVVVVVVEACVLVVVLGSSVVVLVVVVELCVVSDVDMEGGPVQELPVGTGQESKQRKAMMSPVSKVTEKEAASLFPAVLADQVAPLTLLIVKALSPKNRSAFITAETRFEKITFVYQALSPSSTVATGPALPTSQSTGS